ncbi:MAG: hypothetical protein PHR06_01475 [Candidatus Cloacimonetes bacterium]|nr:hypothetical protein [Candidatus Cloacimonadota bacterium]
MTQTFANRIRIIIILLFALTIIMGLSVILQLHYSSDLSLKLLYAKNSENRSAEFSYSDIMKISNARNNIETTIYVIIIIQLITTLFLVFRLPNLLKNALSSIRNILKDISKGNYDMEIDMNSYEDRLDPEFLELISHIRTTLISIKRFDISKKEKIVENRNRISGMMSITDEGIMVFDIKGELKFSSDAMFETFPTLNIDQSIFDTNFVAEIENSIKKYIVQTLKNRSKSEETKYFISSLKRHITIRSHIVRDSKGSALGAIFCIPDLSRKKIDRKEKEETPANE